MISNLSFFSSHLPLRAASRIKQYNNGHATKVARWCVTVISVVLKCGYAPASLRGLLLSKISGPSCQNFWIIKSRAGEGTWESAFLTSFRGLLTLLIQRSPFGNHYFRSFWECYSSIPNFVFLHEACYFKIRLYVLSFLLFCWNLNPDCKYLWVGIILSTLQNFLFSVL